MEATYHEQKKIIPILQIVLYFYPAHDHGTHLLQETIMEVTGLTKEEILLLKKQ